MRTGIRTFYILALTQVFSMLGSAMSSFAIAVWVFTETGNTTPLYLVSFFTFLPRMFFESVAGVFADRMSRKMLIIVGDAGQAIPTLLLMLSFMTGSFALWQLYAAALMQAIFSMLQGPSITASVTMLVPDNHRDRANSLLAIMNPLAGVLAPTLGAFFYSFLGVVGVLVIDLFTFVVAVSVISRIHIPQPPKGENVHIVTGTIWSEVQGAWQFLKQHRGLLYLVLYFSFTNFISNGAFRMFTPFILSISGNNEILLGFVQMGFSLGLVVGGLIPLVWRGFESRIKTVLLGLGLAGLGIVIFPVLRLPLALIIMSFMMALPYKFTNALSYSVQQAKIPAEIQGRVFALSSQIGVFAMPLIYLITGPITDKILEPAVGKRGWEIVAPIVGDAPGSGMALYIMVCGAIYFLATVFAYNNFALRHLETDLPDYNVIPVPASQDTMPLVEKPAPIDVAAGGS